MQYAIINNLNFVCDVLDSETEPLYPPTESGINFKAVECNDTVKINMIYNPETGEFSEVVTPEPEPETEPEPKPLSDTEAAILDTSINTEYLVCLADLGI